MQRSAREKSLGVLESAILDHQSRLTSMKNPIMITVVEEMQ
jgi:hypothetical protein